MATVSGTITDWDSSLMGMVYDSTWTYSTFINMDGTWSVSDVADGSYTFIPDDGGMGGSFDPTSQSVQVSGSDVTGVDFTYSPPTVTLSGHAYRLDSDPIEGATLELYDEGSVLLDSTSSDADGYWEFAGQPINCFRRVKCVNDYPVGYVYGPDAATVAAGYACFDVYLLTSDVADLNFGGEPYIQASEGWLVLGNWDAGGLYVWDDTDERYECTVGGIPFALVLSGGNYKIERTDVPVYSYYDGDGDTLPAHPWAVGINGGSYPPRLYEAMPWTPPATQDLAADWGLAIAVEGALVHGVDLAAQWGPGVAFGATLSGTVDLAAAWGAPVGLEALLGLVRDLGGAWESAPDFEGELTGGLSRVLYRLARAVTANPGGMLECRVRILISESTADTGLLVGYRDGTSAHGIYLRADGLNAQGQGSLSCDNTGWIKLRVMGRNGRVRVFRNGQFLGEWAGAADAGASGLYLGLSGVVHAELDWLRFAVRHWD